MTSSTTKGLSRGCLKIILTLISLQLVPYLYGEQVIYDDDHVSLVEPSLMGVSDRDTSLLASPTPLYYDPYKETLKYYRSPISTRRRALDWWLEEAIRESLIDSPSTPEMEIDKTTLRLSSSTNERNLAALLTHSLTTKRGVALSASLSGSVGRDMQIEGVFGEELRPELHLTKIFAPNHHLSIDLAAPYLRKGLRGSASAEVIELTGDRLYNPSWGLYQGEVRNSRVATYSTPTIEIGYQLPLSRSTILQVDLEGRYAQRSISRLGWYDSYNPWPDYYRNLPSYLPTGEIHDAVESMWREGDTDYTQINWDELTEINFNSPDGDSYYVVESRVEQRGEFGGEVIFSSSLSNSVELLYGAEIKYSNTLHFKEMEDLLGGEYLLDIDQYIGDEAHMGTTMQNNLRDPNRKIKEGDRFDYNYTLSSLAYSGLVGIVYNLERVTSALHLHFGEQRTQRIGHYEKERFAGSLSYGPSQQITLQTCSLRGRINYSISPRHNLSLEGFYIETPPDDGDLFILEEYSNQQIENPTTQSSYGVSLAYSYSTEQLRLNLEAFLFTSRDRIDVWQYYDDLSYTYSDAVISQMATRSVGVELSCSYRPIKQLNIDFTLAAGDYRYIGSPLVTLYDDVDLTKYSTSQATALVGCHIASAPTVELNTGIDLFAQRGFILSCDMSYLAGLYSSPSPLRRTERILSALQTMGLESAAKEQSRHSDIFNLSLGCVKSIFLARDRYLSIVARIDNLLGDQERVEYGVESSRILRNSAESTTALRYLQPDSYLYARSRTLYLSCSYNF